MLLYLNIIIVKLHNVRCVKILLNMNSTICNTCHDGGYLDFEVHCDCSIGVFYETRDELSLQTTYDEFDTGYESIDYDEFDTIYTKLYLLSILPFYDGTKVTDNTEYDDSSDEYYDLSDDDCYNMRDNSPWISDYTWNFHDEGDCNFPCDACAYIDSTW